MVDAEPSEPETSAVGARTWRDRWDDVRFPVLCFLGLAAVLYTVSYLSITFLPRNAGYPIQTPLVFRGAKVLEGWVRYDGGWYKHIATTGCDASPNDCGYNYHPGAQSSVAFFPAYPLAMRFLGFVTGDVLLAGILITFTCGLATAVLFYRWCCRLLSPSTAKAAVLLFLVFPYAWYVYGAVYADALFLACTIGAFLLVEKDRPVLAGLVAAVATAARPVGIGVIIGLVVVLLDRRGVIDIPYLDRVRDAGWRGARQPGSRKVVLAPRRLQLRDAGILLSAGGFAAWCTYLWVVWGSPFIFSEIEGVPGWDQAQGPRTWFKIHWLGLLHHFPEYVTDRVANGDKFIYTIDVSFQGLLAVGCLLLLPLVVRRIGWSYAVYVLAVVMLPVLGTKDWMGTGRYLLAAFPVFAALASWLVDGERTRLRIGLTAASAAILVVLTSAYARGYYLS